MEENSAVQQMALHYLNERSCHRILLYNRDLIERVLALISRQKQKMESCTCRIAFSIYQVEIDRVEWILTEYLLIRLEKIRRYVHIDTSVLSEEEKEYHQAYIELQIQSGTYIEKEEVPSRLCKTMPNYSGVYFLDGAHGLSLEGETLSFSAGDFAIADIQCIPELVDSMSVILV